MKHISDKLIQIQQQISKQALDCGRNPSEITLLAVSKTKPVEQLLQAYHAGQRHFGENYLQEAEDKISHIDKPDIHWHFIGRIQSNKTRTIAKLFDWVHAVASEKHATRLSQQRSAEQTPINLCIQVNLTGEQSKGGVTESELPNLANHIANLPHIRLRGLMTLPEAASSKAELKTVFSQLRHLLVELNQQGHTLDTLSMGMSGDMDIAICEGATIVRIGTAIFGAR